MMQKEYNRKIISIRKKIIDMIHNANAPHVGSALSCVEILVAVYECSDIDKIKAKNQDRDYVILSKGHAIAAQLATLNEYGLISEKVLTEFCKIGSVFMENTSPYTPYIECATGSLGQGISFGVGTALGMKLNQYKEPKTYVIMGDGELNEGQCWEAFEQASCMELDNLVVLIDENKLSGIGETCNKGKIMTKMEAFGFETSVVDGHNIGDIIGKIRGMDSEGKPKAIICSTVKGKGISFMENENNWHYRPVCEVDYKRAILELGYES